MRSVLHAYGAALNVLPLLVGGVGYQLMAVPMRPRNLCRRCYWLRRVNSCTHEAGQRA